jgi:hypothetical protein
MTLVPAEIPFIRPVLLTVATFGVADTHGVVVAASAEPVSWIVDPVHTVRGPVMVGTGSTMKVSVFVQPSLLV